MVCKNIPSLLVYYLIPRNSNTEVLIVPSKDGWTLPFWRDNDFCALDHSICQGLAEELGQQLGVFPMFTVLYCAYQKNIVEHSKKIEANVYVIETHAPFNLPEDARWVSQKELSTLKMSARFCPMLDAIENLLNPSPSATKVYRVPWQTPGWFENASKWTKGVLLAHGCKNVDRIVQMRNRSHTYVVRYETDKGDFYFKTSHPSVKEASFTQWISNIFPQKIPKLLQVNNELNAFVMESFEKTHKEPAEPDLEAVAACYRYFGKMQLESIEYMRDPENIAGIPKSRFLSPKFLASQIDVVLSNSELHKYLKSDELLTFRSCMPIWTEMCERLENAGIPCAVAHRDLHCLNYARSK